MCIIVGVQKLILHGRNVQQARKNEKEHGYIRIETKSETM